MANYAANARTNAFFIDSIEGRTTSLAQYGLTVSEEPHIADSLIDAGAIREDGAQSVKLFAYGGWPTMGEDSVAERLELVREGWRRANRIAQPGLSTIACSARSTRLPSAEL